jgi:hypothetical protein
MRPIYKILSVLFILILTGSVYAAVQSSYTYTGCLAANTPLQISSLDKGTFYNIQPGSQPISACKTGDYLVSLYDQVQVDSLINTITNQINSLTTRISNLENDPYPAVYAAPYKVTGLPTNNQIYELNSLTFVLPKDAYCIIQEDGMMISYLGYAYTNLIIDNNGGQGAWYGDGKYDGSGEWTGFEKADVQYLTAGAHTVRVDGLTYGGNPEAFARISVTALDKGMIQNQAVQSTGSPIVTPPTPPMHKK